VRLNAGCKIGRQQVYCYTKKIERGSTIFII